MAKSQPVPKGVVCPEWESNLKEVLFSEEQLTVKAKEMAAQISADYKGKGKVLVVGLLKGAFMFAADLCRHLTIPYDMDFMALSSYGSGTKSSGSVKVKKDLSIDPHSRHVLIVEDLIDTGGTLQWMEDYLSSKNCASVKLACMLSKEARRSADVKVDYVGYDCPDYFVVGYGMDFNDEYRCMPFVGVLKPEAYGAPAEE